MHLDFAMHVCVQKLLKDSFAMVAQASNRTTTQGIDGPMPDGTPRMPVDATQDRASNSILSGTTWK